jgi:hypothetical protein
LISISSPLFQSNNVTAERRRSITHITVFKKISNINLCETSALDVFSRA